MATALEIDDTTPYIRALINDCNSTYAYGTKNEVNKRLYRYDADFVERQGAYVFPGGGDFSVIEVYTTKTNGTVFVVGKSSVDSRYSLYKTTDHGDSFTKVLNLGDDNGTHVPQVWALQRAFKECTIGGVATYLIGLYNTNSSRVDGGTNDKVCIYSSTDGTNWTPIATWNTVGHQIRHVHCINQDEQSGIVYIGTGDLDNETGIIAWDTSIGIWQDNKTLLELNAIPGFKTLSGDSKYKQVDILITDNFIHWFADTTGTVTASAGIWRAKKDLTDVQRVSSYIVGSDRWGWAGCVMPSGSIIHTSGVSAASPDSQGLVLKSDDEGETYDVVGLLGYSTASQPGYARVSAFGDKVIFAISPGAGKAFGDTAVAVDTTHHSDPAILHPVYFVDPGGINDAATGRGQVKSMPWKSLNYALTANRITNGARVLFSPGDFSEVYPSSLTIAANVLPGTGRIVIEGSGRNVTNVFSGLGFVGVQLLSVGDNSNNQKVTLKKLSMFSKVSPTVALIYVGSSTSSGTEVTIEESKIGDELFDINKDLFRVYDNLAIDMSKIVGSSGDISIVFMKAGASLSFINSESEGGLDVIFQNGMAGLKIKVVKSLLRDYTRRGVSYSIDPSELIVINNIFKAASGTYGIYNSGGYVEVDEYIDNNCFHGGTSTSGVTNGGGSHKITTDPKFVSEIDYHLSTDSPCLGTGTKIPGINKDIENNPIFPPYNIGPYGLSEGALGVSPVANDGPPRNNITRLSGASTTIHPTDTYKLADTNACRIVTEWVAGTANFAFDANGVPIPFTGQQLIDAGIGPRLYCGSKGVAGYVVDQDAPTNAKIIKILKVPTYIDTLYWADYQEFNWEPTSGE